MNEHKRLIKNTGIIAIGNISTKLVSFLLLPLYTAILSASEYGIVDYIISISTFCAPAISLLMEESMFRFLIDCKNDEDKSKVISIALMYILSGGVVFSLITFPILRIVKYQYSQYLLLYILSVVVSSMISALLRGIGRTDKYAIYHFLMTTCQLVLNVLFIAIFFWGVKGMLLASILAHLIFPIIYIVRLRLWKYISFNKLDKELAKEMIRYSIPLIPNKLSWTIINLSDRIIIMNVIGSEASGLYAVSYKFPNLMDTVYGFFYQSWKESSARVVKQEGQNAFYNQVYGYLKSFMYSIVLGMTAFMPLVFHFMVDSSYNEAILYVPILLLGTYFANISGFYGGIFTAHKETKIMGTTTIIAAILNLLINLILIWRIGLYAAAISTLLANMIVYWYRRIKVHKYVTLKENRIKTVISWIATLVIFGLFYSQNIFLQTIGSLCAVMYAIWDNYELLLMIFQRVKRN